MWYLPFVLSFLALTTLAQYPPPQLNLTTITSPADGNITISYKSPPAGICTTVFSTQQQYTGWVNIPGDYATNTFFWFFGARDPTDVLTIWINGGPGSSSMIGLFTENGPCEVQEKALGQFETVAREWGWDRGSNMLYIDQPNQVGFSYDVPTNGSLDLLTSDLYTPPQTLPDSQPSDTFMNGTFSSLNTNNTANTTAIAAMSIWHMLQGFLGAFPEFKPTSSNSSVVNINLFAESYGGKYGPAFATLWEKQNKLRANGGLPKNTTFDINLVSLGIVNGCVDDLVQAPYYPVMAVNNTFGLTAINPTRATLANGSFYGSGGCQSLINQCRTAVAVNDPNGNGESAVTNSACANAYNYCVTNVMEPYNDAGRSVYDIAHYLPDSFPSSSYLEYLNTASFLQAIGSPVNYTQTNYQVVSAFQSTGDYERDAWIPSLSTLLDSGIRIGLIYGDRDYICNWYGGEAVSLAIANGAKGNYPTQFQSSGYAPIIVNSSYIGGVVREYGNLSFSRIYDAGHSVPAYQPETAFQVFARIIDGTSLSTGENIDLSSYNTSGPLNATHTNSLPSSPSATCYLRNIIGSCTDDQKNMIIDGKGAIINGILYDASSDWPGSTSIPSTATSGSATAGSTAATTTTVTATFTGVYVATATPSQSKQSAANKLTLISKSYVWRIWSIVLVFCAWTAF